MSNELTITDGLLLDIECDNKKGEKVYPSLKKGNGKFSVSISGNSDDYRDVTLDALIDLFAQGVFEHGAQLRMSPKNGGSRNGHAPYKGNISDAFRKKVEAKKRTLQELQASDLTRSPIPSSTVSHPADNTSNRSSPQSEDAAQTKDDLAEGELALKGTGYESDSKIRKAIEEYAVAKARDYYKRNGYSVIERGKPYDLLCESPEETIHVEVKGSRQRLEAIIVTIGEVRDACDSAWRSDLFLVDDIILESDGKGGHKAGGGVCRVQRNWVPDNQDLIPTQYRYKLPSIPVAE